jgi:uncharacterized membrane protein YraQ (UPF0718 family)
MRSPLHLSTLVLFVCAGIVATIAYIRDPGLPWIGAKNGLPLLWFIIPRLFPALILAGLLQVLVPQEVVSRIIAREAPLMGWRFVAVRVTASLAFPVLAGCLVATFYSE